MKVPGLDFAALEMPRLGLASFRRRIIFRGVFLLLAMATLALALVLLKEEKERSYLNHAQAFRKTQAEVMARLRHPAGQLALLNPSSRGAAPLHPLMLPYGALDFDDQNKAQQAVELSGCSVRYPDGGRLCVAIGNNPYAGGFIYLVGSFASGELVPRERGMTDLSQVHRARISLTMRGETQQWLAPFEALSAPGAAVTRGRLTGFADTGASLDREARPVRDFRGWLWRSGACEKGAGGDCLKRAFFSIRLPVEAYREALFQKREPVWPPPDLEQTGVRMEVFGPGGETPLFDSAAPGAQAPFSLQDLSAALLPGETVQVRKAGVPGLVASIRAAEADETPPPWLSRLIRRLPVDVPSLPQSAMETLATAGGNYEVVLTADSRGIERSLGIVATRVSWYVGAMLGAIFLAWLIIEVGFIRRVTLLTRRAAAVSYNVQDARLDQRIGALDLSDLRGSDELGILAGGLSDLLQRVKDDVRREQIRAVQEKDMWQAVGHEIMSPLQSLMVLHPSADDQSHRYVQRMQQAVRVLYGTASPGEALEAATLQVSAMDLDAFLRNVAANAHFAGIDGVVYESAGTPLLVRADEFPLEDAVTHVLRNADRFRVPGTQVTLDMTPGETTATFSVRNTGPSIPGGSLQKIFEYGVSDGPGETAEHRGQGLFVARTYMAKMGGTVEARNTKDGVAFVFTLRRAA